MSKRTKSDVLDALTLDKVERWAAQFPSGKHVGARGLGNCCPIYRYLKDCGFSVAYVQLQQIDFEENDRAYYILPPPPILRLIVLIDLSGVSGHKITAGKVVRLIARVRREG